MGETTAVAIKERPILFSGPMVRAILEGRKTQTRRVITLPRWAEPGDEYAFEMDGITINGVRYEDWPYAIAKVSGCLAPIQCPYGVPGDRLWVRETWRGGDDTLDSVFYKADGCIVCEKYSPYCEHKWRPSIFMPVKFSRITLEITKVRVERVQDISEADAQAEGLTPSFENGSGRDQYAKLWDSINAKRGYGWDENPWVWVLEFRRV